MNKSDKKLGLLGLLAIVFGSMIGSGIFNITQNMAVSAGMGATIIAWIVTLIGMTFLAMTFKVLATHQKEIKAGIYEYAKAGFGDYVGFNVAWGYWISAAFSNVAYVILLNDCLGVFFPQLLEHQIPTAIFGTCLIWVMYFVVSLGFNTAIFINATITIIKFATILMILILLTLCFNSDLAFGNLWIENIKIGSIGNQVKNTMMVTLWCFIGIEGAAMMNSKAKNQRDVGKAGIFGLILAWLLYMVVSILSFGVMGQPELANLENPSLAYLLKYAVGDWAYYFVITAVFISISGCWLSWTLLCAQVPYDAAKIGLMPERFMHLNRHGMPSFALLITSIIVQSQILLLITADSVYLRAVELTSVTILPSYLFSGAFLMKTANNGKDKKRSYWVIGTMCTIFCLWMIYASGLELIMISSIIYIAGTYFYIQAKSHRDHFTPTKFYKYFSKKEKLIFFTLLSFAILSVIYLIIG